MHVHDPFPLSGAFESDQVMQTEHAQVNLERFEMAMLIKTPIAAIACVHMVHQSCGKVMVEPQNDHPFVT